jgi:Bacterial pre-peptidase C-terminal domain
MRSCNGRLGKAGLVGIAHLLVAGMALGQAPRISYVMPVGGKAGSTFDLVITGVDIEKANDLYFNFPGAKTEVLGSEAFKPTIDPKKAPPGIKGLISQRFRVTLPADTPIGIHDVRVVTANGISNPRTFVVGDLQEFNEQEPNDDLPKAQKITVNSTVNGTIAIGTDVDYYLFAGTKGQRIVVSCLTTSIDSKLPAVIALYSMSGTLLGDNKGYKNNDALVGAVLPADGEYYVRVASFTYTQGGPDYFYRLSVSTAPWIDAVFPPCIEPGNEVKVTVYGRNLPGGVPDPSSLHDGRVLEKAIVTVKAPSQRDAKAFHGYVPPLAATVDPFSLSLKNEAGTSNNFMMTLAAAPVVLESGTNDSRAKAQRVAAPCEIAGQIEKKNNRDWYSFSAMAGQVLTIEVFGDRVGSPVDMYFALYNDKGTLVTEQDDNPDITANQFYRRTDDPPTYRFTVPADGEYKLMVASKFSFRDAGPRYFYTVRIMEETPNFTLVAMPVSQLTPDSVVINQASHQAYTVFVFRHGGFTGDVTLTGANLPPGITVQPQVIGGNQKQANLIVSAGAGAPPFAGGISVVGTGTVNGTKLVREVRAATITWPVAQAAPTISRLDRELTLAVRGPAPYLLAADNEAAFTQGEKIIINLKVTRQGDFKKSISIVALNLPANLVQQPLTIAAGADSGKLVFDYKGGSLPAGTKLTLALRGQTLAPVAKGVQPKGTEPTNFLQTCNPISVTIVPKKTGRLAPPLRPNGDPDAGYLAIRSLTGMSAILTPSSTNGTNCLSLYSTFFWYFPADLTPEQDQPVSPAI